MKESKPMTSKNVIPTKAKTSMPDQVRHDKFADFMQIFIRGVSVICGLNNEQTNPILLMKSV